jgi:hypothetical protein
LTRFISAEPIVAAMTALEVPFGSTSLWISGRIPVTRRMSSAKVATAMWSASESCESIRIGKADEEEAKVSAESLAVKERMLGIPRARAKGSARSSVSSRIIVFGRTVFRARVLRA